MIASDILCIGIWSRGDKALGDWRDPASPPTSAMLQPMLASVYTMLAYTELGILGRCMPLVVWKVHTSSCICRGGGTALSTYRNGHVPGVTHLMLV